MRAVLPAVLLAAACARGPSPSAGGAALDVPACPTASRRVDGFPLLTGATEDAALAGSRTTANGTYTFRVYRVERPFAVAKAFYRKCLGEESHESEDGSFHWKGEVQGATLTISKGGDAVTLVRIGKVVK